MRNLGGAYRAGVVLRAPLPCKGSAPKGRGHGSLSHTIREGVLQGVEMGDVRFPQCLCVL
jgi:hypothetical protein